jgi:hypothetical protein
MDVSLLPGSRPRSLAANSHDPPTLMTAISGLSHNQNRSDLTTGGLPPISSLWRQAPWDDHKFFFAAIVLMSLREAGSVVYKLLLSLASVVILGSESRGSHDYILLSQFRDAPNIEGQVPVLYSQRTGWPSYTPRHWVPFYSPVMTRRATMEVF